MLTLMWGFSTTDFIDCETFDMATRQILEWWRKVAAQMVVKQAADFLLAPKFSWLQCKCFWINIPGIWKPLYRKKNLCVLPCNVWSCICRKELQKQRISHGIYRQSNQCFCVCAHWVQFNLIHTVGFVLCVNLRSHQHATNWSCVHIFLCLSISPFTLYVNYPVLPHTHAAVPCS